MDVDYRVELDTYSGPLDLLLFLVRRHEIDLHDIPIAELTDQYLRHLEVIKQINVEVVGEFLVMAATLLEIKSTMLLPPQPTPEGEEAGPTEVLDPRFELVQQLLAYKRFKDAAMDLDERHTQWQARFARRPARPESRDHAGTEVEGAERIEIDLEDVHLLDLREAFSHILESIGHGAPLHEVVLDDTPIALHVEDLVDRLGRDGPMTLQQIFVGRTGRSELIGLFLATLELVRQRRIRIRQKRIGGEIGLELCSEEERRAVADQEDREHDWRDPETGEIQYDWPSEEARQRAERRAALRIARFKNRRFGADGDQEADEIIDVDGDDEDSDDDNGTEHEPEVP